MAIGASSFGALAQSQKLTVTTFGYDAKQFEGYQQVIDAFYEKHPDIEVEVINIPGVAAYREKLFTMIAGGSPPDVMMLSDDGFREFVSRGILMDLTPFIEQDASFDRSQYFEATFQAFEYDGHLYGIPRRANNMVMYYNRDLFKAAGVSEPTPDWTWDDFLAAAQQLTKGEGPGKQYGVVFETMWLRAFPWIWQNGGSILTEDYSEPTMTKPETIEALQFLSDLIQTYEVAPPVSVTGDLGTLQMFLTGRVAMVPTGAWMIPQYRTADFDWNVAPLPMKKFKASPLYTSAYAVSAKTSNPDAAWEFTRFMASEYAQRVDAEVPTALPTLRSVAYSPDWLAEPGETRPENPEVFLEAMDNGRMMPLIEQWSQLSSVMQREFDLLWLGAKSAEDVANALQAEIKRILD